jgi:acetyltransferase-like isoleucine patch superfamily enzyme
VLRIHDSARISSLAEIEESMRGSVIEIGPECDIDAFVRIRAAGGSGDVKIGRRCFINSGCVLYVGNGIQIGDYVSIASNCTLAPTNHEFVRIDVPIQFQGFRPSRGGIVIEDDVWVGAGTVILDGSVLRRGCVIGAMSLVRGEVPPWGIYAGNPLRRLGTRQPEV